MITTILLLMFSWFLSVLGLVYAANDSPGFGIALCSSGIIIAFYAGLVGHE